MAGSQDDLTPHEGGWARRQDSSRVGASRKEQVRRAGRTSSIGVLNGPNVRAKEDRTMMNRTWKARVLAIALVTMVGLMSETGVVAAKTELRLSNQLPPVPPHFEGTGHLRRKGKGALQGGRRGQDLRLGPTLQGHRNRGGVFRTDWSKPDLCR